MRFPESNLQQGLQESEKFPEPLFTPSTKAEIGEHDENISAEQAMQIVDKNTFNAVKEATIKYLQKSFGLCPDKRNYHSRYKV